MKFISKYFLFGFVILIFGTTNSFTQEVKRLNTNEGILRGRINKFEKDSLGFLWIGTSKGISRYSGVEFRKYDIKDVSSQESSWISDILNLNGNLFVSSFSGVLMRYEYDFDQFKEILYIKNKRLLSLAKLNDRKFLIGLSRGFIIYDIETKQASETLFPDTFINRELIVDGSNVYVATARGCDHYIFNDSENTLVLKKDFLSYSDIIDIAIDDDKKLWIGTEVGGLYLLNDDKIKKVAIKEISKKTNAIRKIEFDKNNNALVAIDRLGLFVIDKNLKVLNTFSHDINKPTTISQNSIYEIYVDESNAYWLGLREGGVNVIYQKSNVFNHVNHILNSKESISNNTIRSIHETANGDLWFGTENGISKLSNNKWTNYNQKKELYNTAILSINEYNNELLLGSYGQGVLKINPKTGSLSQPDLYPKVQLDFVFNISVFDGNLWVSGIDGPLHHYYQKKLVSQYKIGLARTIIKGFNNLNYAGATNGFFEINKRNKSLRKIKPHVFNSVNEVHSLELDPINNAIWIGSTNGIYKFNLSDESLENIGQTANKKIGTVFSIKKDNLENLYLATISGLWRFDIKNKLFRKYDDQDGLHINQFGVGEGSEFEDGRFAFGGSQGAVIFNPYNLEKDNLISDTFITNFEVNGKKPDSLTLKKNINFVDEVTLNYDQNSFSFNFQTIKFHGSKRNTFKYQLKGYENDFKRSGNNNKITYANLKPGKYELFNLGYNADGIESKKPYQLKIIIKKPFWQTWTAISLYICLFVLFLYLIYFISKAKHRKRTDEDRIKFFVEVAHDIRTPVSLIQLLVKQLANQKEVKKSIELIQRNTENLNEYVTQLLDFQKIDRNQLKLAVSRVDLKSVITNITSDFSPLLEKNSIDIEINIDKVFVWFDKAKMSRIFYNLISNAIKYSNEGGQININASINEKHLKLAFIDDGIGIPEKQQAIIFKRFTRGTNVTNKGIPGTGIGLMLSKKIVELHGGEITIESRENIGSTFTIILPLGSEHYQKDEIIKENISEDKDAKSVEKLITKDKIILLVEDTLALREAIKTELDEDYTVIEAANGKEGLLIALSKNPDLIITDVMMPEMSGKELCNLLKTNFKTSHIPVIMLTALVNEEDKLKGLKIGADAYIEKPFNLEILKATINNLIKSRENLSNLLEDKKVEKQLTPDERFLSEVIETIKENLTSNDFSIDSLCDKMGLSRSNMFRKLKGLIQMSPSDLIIKIKLSHAEEMMKSKKKTRISDIAYESGFNDPKYFSTLFKKHYQQTPKEYMEKV
ncbi:ATP-binding protein [Polaribacter sp.]|uniref:hybrid sensor histidine kinase/response regulator transcription factor n=1 Tax=Polaribacter sp. TaxID=1920175 RepID=UPI003F6C774D